VPTPRGTGEEDDLEWRELALIISIRRNMLNPDPVVQRLLANLAAEVVVLQDVRRGRNDCG
jgi:hypothetical protein